MFQKEKVSEKIEEVVKQDIWGSIKEFLQLGLQIGEGDKRVDITIGLLLLLIAVSYTHLTLPTKRIV